MRDFDLLPCVKISDTLQIPEHNAAVRITWLSKTELVLFIKKKNYAWHVNWQIRSERRQDKQLPESFCRSCNKTLIALRSLQTSSCRSWGYPRWCGHHRSRCWDQADLCGALSSGFSGKRSKVFLFVRELAGRCLLMGKRLLWDSLLYGNQHMACMTLRVCVAVSRVVIRWHRWQIMPQTMRGTSPDSPPHVRKAFKKAHVSVWHLLVNRWPCLLPFGKAEKKVW